MLYLFVRNVHHLHIGSIAVLIFVDILDDLTITNSKRHQCPYKDKITCGNSYTDTVPRTLSIITKCQIGLSQLERGGGTLRDGTFRECNGYTCHFLNAKYRIYVSGNKFSFRMNELLKHLLSMFRSSLCCV